MSLGKRLDFTTGFASPPAVADDCKLLVVDPEPDALESARRAAGARLALACEADVGATIHALVKKAPGQGARSAYREEVAAALAEKPAAKGDAGNGPMHPAHLCASVQQILDKADDPVLNIDGGEFGQWAQACLSAKTRIINGPSGAIGGCLCYAAAAKAARPGATVVVLMGDGTAGFHFAEFETAHRHGYGFLAVIGNDARWNAEYQIQLRDYGENRTYACELNPTRYDEAVAGLGGHGENVNTPGELDAALERALKSGVPSCVNVAIESVPAPAGPSSQLAPTTVPGPANGANQNVPANTAPTLPSNQYNYPSPTNPNLNNGSGNPSATGSSYRPRVQESYIRPLPDLERDKAAPALLNPDDRTASRSLVAPGTIMPISWQTETRQAVADPLPVENSRPKTRRLSADGWRAAI